MIAVAAVVLLLAVAAALRWRREVRLDRYALSVDGLDAAEMAVWRRQQAALARTHQAVTRAR